MKKIKWHSGPPPSIGWWPTRDIDKDYVKAPVLPRWWNEHWWSIPVWSCWNSKHAGELAQYQFMHCADRIKWCDRPKSWPERSRT